MSEKDRIEHGVSSISMPIGDGEVLSQAISQLVQSPEFRQSLAQKACERAREFDISVISPQYERLLKAVIAA